MVATVLNADSAQPSAQILLADHLRAFCDVDVVVAHKHFPAHRAVLAIHSLDFRAAFVDAAPESVPAPPGASLAPDPAENADVTSAKPALPRFRVHIALDHLDQATLRHGWQLVYSYIYGERVSLDTDAVLAALPICRRYRFHELAAVLEAYLCEGAVNHENCNRVFAAAATRPVAPSTPPTFHADTQLVLNLAWTVMKSHFSIVSDWGYLPYNALVRLLKINDLNIDNEFQVFEAVQQWLLTNSKTNDEKLVAGLVKLVRFPTMTQQHLEEAAASSLLSSCSVCRKYLNRGLAAKSDEKRGLVRSVVMENSPIYRRRHTDALTFSDRVRAWSKVEEKVNLSSRYFADCLWNLIIEKGHEWISVFLACQSEGGERQVDVELDFSIFIVRHTGGEPELVTKQVKGACFGKSGQCIGFKQTIRTEDIEKEGSRFLLRDTLFVGASIRLRCSRREVIGIREGDDTADSTLMYIE